ncbi:MAG: glycosyltransferase [Shinella sp.]|nr:glycosyltransferase [Shinella sp.]
MKMDKLLTVEKQSVDKDLPPSKPAALSGAANRVRRQLNYRLGSVLVQRSGSLRAWMGIPRAMILEIQAFNAEQRINPTNELPPLHEYSDVKDAQRVKKHLSYRLGDALLKYGRSPLGWPVLPFALLRAVREFRKQPRRKGADRNVAASPQSDSGGRPTASAAVSAAPVHYYFDVEAPSRLPLETMVAKLAAYDVISFDIFDTAVVRAVAKPNDVFRLMGARLGITGFVKKRKDAEAYARTRNDRLKGTREVTLHEIYEVLTERHGAKAEWEQLEKDLEVQLTRQNPYIFQVYERLRAMGKTLIFMSDMYLPKETITAMLARAGYSGYERLYLSNEYGARKGDGTLQQVVVADYGPDRLIVHVGDVYEADVVQSIASGIAGVYNPNQHALVREKDMGSLAGSFYEAVVDNALGTGTWSEGIHYTHGFRVGGILTLGYVEFLDRLAREKGIEKILFLGRDCDILSQVYRRFFGTLPSEYIDTSRTASLMLTAEWSFDDYISRAFFRWYKESNNSRPISQLLIDTGFEYLVEHLEGADIEPLQFPASANEPRLREFFWMKKSVIEAHLAESYVIARDYFSKAIGGAKKVLVVDIGWTGTCITALRDFFRNNYGEHAPQVFGALLATSRNEQITDAVSDGSISAYVYSPLTNQDIARLVMPVGKIPQKQKDLLTLPIEYLFTEPNATTIGYARDELGEAVALRGSNIPPNPEQILEMQRGIIDFVERYLEYSQGFANLRMIGPYVAFQPLRHSLGHRPYLYQVYKDFLYDAVPVLHGDTSVFERFGDLFDSAHQLAAAGRAVEQTPMKRILLPRILFVSPEMTYTGTPHSLLRLCKIAVKLGYEPIVWTSRPGPFAREFETHGFTVHVVTSAGIDKSKIDDLMRDNVKLVVCNTVVTDGYVRAFEGKLPVVWYVREATNVPQFLRGNSRRADMLRRSSSVTVVSDYAAEAISMYADGPIDVVKNAVEDVSEFALPYVPAKDGVIRFVQLGTIEHRKGYDLFVAAYKAMPEEYRVRAELHFAGGFINSGTSFASYVFGQFKNEPRIHYHGLIADVRQKVELLSQMDVVVVASRDESCSLVALEGAMLSKPLIVTENVGAKYMVDDENGITVSSGEVKALRDAFMRMIDRSPGELVEMGGASRRKYDTLASMRTHQSELGELFARRIAGGPIKSSVPRERTETVAASAQAPGHSGQTREIIVSLTSFPPRMPTIATCVESLMRQTKQPDRILLWLSEDQFPDHGAGLPAELRALLDERFQIRWVEGDLAPHKKYFYVMQEFPNALIVTVDDDVRYDEHLIATLYHGHLDRPSSVVAGRSNLIRFRPDGTLRTYDQWGYDHQHLRERETFELLPTGIGGVLYPPGSVPAEAFDINAIKATSLHADDLWLKVMTTANGYPVWMPQRKFEFRNIDGSQSAALWRGNAFQNGNDLAMGAILEFFEQNYGNAHSLLRRIRGVRADGTFVGPGDDIERSSLIQSRSIFE